MVYVGRNENLVGPLLEQFTEQTGIQVDVPLRRQRRAGRAAARGGRPTARPTSSCPRTPARSARWQEAGCSRRSPSRRWPRSRPAYRAPTDRWVGLSGRARVIIYDPDQVAAAELPPTSST